MSAEPSTAVILNPRAAAGRVHRRRADLERAIRDAVGACTVMPTEYRQHATALARQALLDGYDRIVSVGGDGTHSEVVNGFFHEGRRVRPEAVLGLVPLGTGTDLGRTLGIPRGAAAAPLLAGGRIVECDVGRVTYRDFHGGTHTSHFINVADFGAGGAVAERTNRSSKRLGGFLSFLWAVTRTLATFQAPRFEIDIDGEHIEQKALDVIVANARYFGGGIHVAPHSRIDDGRLDVLVVHDLPFRTCLRHLRHFYTGSFLDKPHLVSVHTASRLEVRSPDRVLVGLDGEQPGTLPATVEVVPRAIRVIAGPPD